MTWQLDPFHTLTRLWLTEKLSCCPNFLSRHPEHRQRWCCHRQLRPPRWRPTTVGAPRRSPATPPAACSGDPWEHRRSWTLGWWRHREGLGLRPSCQLARAFPSTAKKKKNQNRWTIGSFSARATFVPSIQAHRGFLCNRDDCHSNLYYSDAWTSVRCWPFLKNYEFYGRNDS